MVLDKATTSLPIFAWANAQREVVITCAWIRILCLLPDRFIFLKGLDRTQGKGWTIFFVSCDHCFDSLCERHDWRLAKWVLFLPGNGWRLEGVTSTTSSSLSSTWEYLELPKAAGKNKWNLCWKSCSVQTHIDESKYISTTYAPFIEWNCHLYHLDFHLKSHR